MSSVNQPNPLPLDAEQNPYQPPGSARNNRRPDFDFTSLLPAPIAFEYTFTKRDYRRVTIRPWLIISGFILCLICWVIATYFYIDPTIRRDYLLAGMVHSLSFFLIGLAMVFSGLAFGEVRKWTRSNQDLLGHACGEINHHGIRFSFPQTSAEIPWSGIQHCLLHRGHVRLRFELEPIRILVLNKAALRNPDDWDACEILFDELRSLLGQPLPIVKDLPERVPHAEAPQIVAEGALLRKDYVRAEFPWSLVTLTIFLYIPFVNQPLVMSVSAMKILICIAIPSAISAIIWIFYWVQRSSTKIIDQLRVTLKARTITLETPAGAWTFDLSLLHKIRIGKESITFCIGKRGPGYIVPLRFFSNQQAEQRFFRAISLGRNEEPQSR